MGRGVLIVIPAYNEAETVATVLKGLRQVVPQFDRVVVNDGSGDATGEVVADLGEKQLKLPCNLGYGQALQTGLKYALIRGRGRERHPRQRDRRRQPCSRDQAARP
jgi:glycosyltransferase involved in cell wall biosynthesis